jgi:hypothetical protein
LRHIIECILADTPPSIVTAEDGLGAVEICEAEEESVQTGRVVSVARTTFSSIENGFAPGRPRSENQKS